MENTGSYLYTEVWKFWDVQKIKKIQTFQSIIQFSTQFATEIYYSTNLYMIPSMWFWSFWSDQSIFLNLYIEVN